MSHDKQYDALYAWIMENIGNKEDAMLLVSEILHDLLHDAFIHSSKAQK